LRLALFIAVVGLLAASHAIACDCSKGSVRSTFSDKNADVIFIGEVAEVEGPDSYGVALVRFKVVEMRQGRHSEFLTIQIQSGEASCNLNAASFKVGERYLMSGLKLVAAASATNEARDKLAVRPRYLNHFCSLRAPLPVTPNKSLERTREG
jgi:hypothetical protein